MISVQMVAGIFLCFEFSLSNENWKHENEMNQKSNQRYSIVQLVNTWSQIVPIVIKITSANCLKSKKNVAKDFKLAKLETLKILHAEFRSTMGGLNPRPPDNWMVWCI